MQLFSGAEIIIHAGDVLYHPPRLGPTEGYDVPGMAEAMNAEPTPIVIARGNCDAEVYEELLDMPVLAPYAVIQHSGLRIVVQHGHTLSEKKMQRVGEKYHADILITGHTHVPVLEQFGKTIHLNPGSPSIPKFEIAGVPTPTVAVISDDSIDVIALEDGRTLISMALHRG